MASQGNHTIRSGETLTSIAKTHGLPGPDCIWRFTKDVRKKPISADPDQIPAGVTISVPLAPSQYDEAIQRLRNLRIESQRDFAEIQADLNQAKRTTDRDVGRLDLAADVIFLAKGAGKASLKYGPRFAKLVMGKNTLKATHALVKASNPNANSVEGQIVHRGLDVAADNSILPMNSRMPSVKNLKRGVGKEALDAGAEWLIRAAKKAEWISGAVADSLEVVADVAIKGVEAANPSKIATAVFAIQYGETPDEVHRKALQRIQQSSQQVNSRLQSKIVTLQKEKRVVYPQ